MSVTSPTMRRRMWKLEQLKMDSDLAIRVINHVLDTTYTDFQVDMRSGTVFLEFFNKLNGMHMKINTKDNIYIHIENHQLFAKAINCHYDANDFIKGVYGEVIEVARGVVAHTHEVDHNVIDEVMEAKEIEAMVKSANIDKLTHKHEQHSILLSQILEDENSAMEIPAPVQKRIESTTTVPTPKKQDCGKPAQKDGTETAVAYACIVLEEAQKEITQENLETVLKASGITGYGKWAEVFTQYMKTTTCDKIMTQLTSGSSAPAASSGAAVAVVEKEKTEEEEMVGGFNMGDSSSEESESSD